AGLLAAAFPIGTFMGGLPGGWLAARIGVRPTVLIGLALMTGASVAFAFAETILVLDVARFIQGLGSAAAWAGAMGWVAAAAPKEKRGQMIGTAMGAAIAGALFGPVIGVGADLIGHEIVFCAVGAVGLVLMAWTARTPAAKPLGDGSLRGLLGSLSDSSVRTGLALVTVPGLMFGTLSVLGPLRLDELGAGAAAIGATWLIAAALEAVVSPVAGHVSDRRGRMAPLLAGLLGGAIVFAILPWPSTALAFAIVVILGTPAIGLLWAPAMASLSDGAERVGLEQGLAFGLMNLTWATGQTLGNLGGARIGEAAGDEVAYLLLSGLCVVCFAVLRTRSIRRPATV
ncbi:MAG TPA: MFS transporter, partial [Solirubrobacter sp.]|nr:MFS transporter [Solirubrobacter sp.]